MKNIMSRKPETSFSRESIDGLAATMRGAIVEPGHPDYDSTRAVYNGMIDRHPAMIVLAADAADVIATVRFARMYRADLAIRGGGHHGGGFGSVDNGIVLDLRNMNGVRVDPVARTARVEGGATWADVDHATHAFGLATVGGTVSSTGVGGLTLGGGIGNLTRKYGLTIDNLLAADVVLSDGTLVTASADEHPDLFWALRGGGGNFGVVTSFLFRLHPVQMVTAGATIWPVEQTTEILRWYRDFIQEASEDLYGFFAFLTVPPVPMFPESLHNQKMAAIVWCYSGPQERAGEVFAPVLEVGTIALNGLQPMPYPAIQRFFDQMIPPGLQWYWKGDFLTELPDEAIALHAEFGASTPTPLSTMHLYPINGAVHRTGSDETAFRHRDATWAMVIGGIDPDPANAGLIRHWAHDYWQTLHPFSADGGYVNFNMQEDQDRIRAAYGDNYDRLRAVKAIYDPTNLFHINQNIAPNGDDHIR